jgi:hypothetical protein
LASVIVSLALSTEGRASFHLWDIKEIFSSADGSVQFIELFTTSAGQGLLNGHQITATSDGVPVSFNFNRNLTGASTANRHFLMATAGFGSLAGGVTPDYTLPANFFNPSAANISINFANSDTVTFAGSLLPTDGVMSLTDQSPAGAQNFVAGINSPTNFSNATGSVNLSPPPAGIDGDYNNNGTVEQADLDLVLLNWGNAAEPPPEGWVNDLPLGSIDQAELDGVLLNWGNMVAESASVPEPNTTALGAAVATTLLIVALCGRGRVAARKSCPFLTLNL